MDENLVALYPDLERQHFWWKTRRKLVLDIYRKWFPSRSPRVLDVGCGSGVTAESLSREGAKVVGVDLEIPVSATSTPSFQMISGDYLDIAPGLGEFDLVLALDVVEHFEDESRVLETLVANTRPGGKMLITVPAFSWLWSSHDTENDHYRRYTRRQLTEALEPFRVQIDRAGYLFLGLIPPKAVMATYERVSTASAPSGTGVVGPMNSMAGVYFEFELWCALHLRNFLPAGTSVVAAATKPG